MVFLLPKTLVILDRSVVGVTFEPEDCRVAIKQETPGIASPAFYQRLVGGARSEAIHEKLQNWKTEVWTLPARGRGDDLCRAAAGDGR